MSGTYFETFLVGGLGLLVTAALAITWLLWRQADTRQEAIKLSLEGIGHEFRFNMFQTVRELADVCEGRIRLSRDIPVIEHPQLNAVLATVLATDKRPLAAVQATYQAIEAAKRRLRYAMDQGEAIDEPLEAAKTAAVNGISTLYLWEKHEGCPPERARSTRSWWVRDWMKKHGFHQDLLPGLYLRDAVVEDLRGSGMELTPKPLMLSAHEYYSRHYDRKADPRGVFGKRKIPKAAPVAMDEEAEAGADIEADADVQPAAEPAQAEAPAEPVSEAAAPAEEAPAAEVSVLEEPEPAEDVTPEPEEPAAEQPAPEAPANAEAPPEEPPASNVSALHGETEAHEDEPADAPAETTTEAEDAGEGDDRHGEETPESEPQRGSGH